MCGQIWIMEMLMMMTFALECVTSVSNANIVGYHWHAYIACKKHACMHLISCGPFVHDVLVFSSRCVRLAAELFHRNASHNLVVAFQPVRSSLSFSVHSLRNSWNCRRSGTTQWASTIFHIIWNILLLLEGHEFQANYYCGECGSFDYIFALFDEWPMYFKLIDANGE